jgi:hypothetical protein
VSVGAAVALVLALASTTLTSLAYLREHDAAAELPVLCMRRPLHSARLLLEDRSWMLGFAMESSGFLLYAAALALAPLALVQSVAAGAIGVLAFASARLARRRLSSYELVGVLISVFGLVALGVSLAGGGQRRSRLDNVYPALARCHGHSRDRARPARAKSDRGRGGGWYGAASFFSIGDISTKLATQGGVRIGFVVTLVIGYTAGTALLQLGYQASAAR